MKKNARWIRIDSDAAAGTVKSHISTSRAMRPFFATSEFHAQYDVDIDCPKSILHIPALSLLLPVAWITGADVHADELDQDFAASMAAIQTDFRQIYPGAPLRSRLYAAKRVKNQDAATSAALLFSGGVDATFSLFNNLHLKPSLIMIFGGDIPASNQPYIELTKNRYSALAASLDLTIHYVHTNALELWNHRRLNHLFRRYQGDMEGDLWRGMGYALGHIGQTAPLSSGRFNQLIFAAWQDTSDAATLQKFHDASAPGRDEKITWAGLRVRHDGCLQRLDKVQRMKEFLRQNHVPLRVCWRRPKLLQQNTLLNCGQCEKCLRTIAALALAGIDANTCGLPLDVNTPHLLKALFAEKKLPASKIELFWLPMQNKIPPTLENDRFGMQHFFAWFTGKDLLTFARPYSPRFSAEGLYYAFPYWLAISIRWVFESMLTLAQKIGLARKQPFAPGADVTGRYHFGKR